MKAATLLCLAGLVVGGHSGSVMAATNRPHVTAPKHAKAGVPLLLGKDYDLDHNCKVIPGLKVVIVSPPSNGIIKVLDHTAFTHYPRSNVRYKCNKKRSQMLATFYTSRPGFAGHDHAVVRVISPLGGTEPVYSYDISVN
ncbi:hypothetical protein [Labrys sp. WJW]|uniref:hypothetical protein n=1 Tax=Labrys sp. WJW TaxID=1737983 RepID=UPI0012E9F8D7|nr:hypothetical protein [Labrys sp. WJW]